MSNFFKNKNPNPQKLLDFGFKKKKNVFIYKTDLLNGDFNLTIKVEIPDKLQTELIEVETKEVYTLHLSDAQGTFVGKIRDEYNFILKDIQEKCFDNHIFKSDYSYKIIDYVKEKYGDNIEYLWEKFPDNGIVRRKDNKKWYLVILTVKKCKLGFNSDENIEVINLKADNVNELIQQPNIYPAYHMNKKYWITIILDGSVDIKEIYKFIDKSYILNKEKNK